MFWKGLTAPSSVVTAVMKMPPENSLEKGLNAVDHIFHLLSCFLPYDRGMSSMN